MSVEGILVPRSWTANGEVADLALNTDDEREYVIEAQAWKPLGILEHLRSRVRLTAKVTGNRLVRIASISVLESLGNASEGPSHEGGET